MKTPKELQAEYTGPWKQGNEFLPYHHQASHVPPDHRDGWNAGYWAAVASRVTAAPQEGVSVPPGYAQRVIDELYENGDPVSVDAAELLTQMISAAHQPPASALPLAVGVEPVAWLVDGTGTQFEYLVFANRDEAESACADLPADCVPVPLYAAPPPLSPPDTGNVGATGDAETYLRKRYGAYRGHFAWRELEEAFNAGAALPPPGRGMVPMTLEPTREMCEACLIEAKFQFGHGITMSAAAQLFRAMVAASTETAVPSTEMNKALAELRFFRDLVHEKRLDILRSFKVIPPGADEEISNHYIEKRLFNKVWDSPLRDEFAVAIDTATALPSARSTMGAAHDVLAERVRQLAKWGNDHDDSHGYDYLASQAADFILPGQSPISGTSWAYKSKVTDRDPRRLQLVKGAALAIAAIDAYDRAEKASTS